MTDSRALTEDEAFTASPPLIDLLAPDVPALLSGLDRRLVTRFDGTTLVLRTAGVHVVPLEMNWRQRLLSAIAHPSYSTFIGSVSAIFRNPVAIWSVWQSMAASARLNARFLIGGNHELVGRQRLRLETE